MKPPLPIRAHYCSAVTLGTAVAVEGFISITADRGSGGGIFNLSRSYCAPLVFLIIFFRLFFYFFFARGITTFSTV
jgi:hypothetical protein